MSRRRRGRPINGILLLDKPIGISSNQALQRARRLFDARKAGHTGNLDVLASGLLPVCFGEATKVCQFLLDADKTYLSEFTFGRRTSTGDSEGETIASASVDDLTEARLRRAMGGFNGWIEQVPPMHSALKRNGQPLYKLAHQGIEVERKTRRVRIDRFDLLGFDGVRADVVVGCSKGTYIRTLAEDLGTALGCGAYVSRLRRTAAGPFHLDAAVDFDRLEDLASGDLGALDALLREEDEALGHMPLAELDTDAARHLRQGRPVRVPRSPGSGMLRLYDVTKRFIGVGEVLPDGRIAPRRLFASAPAAEP